MTVDFGVITMKSFIVGYSDGDKSRDGVIGLAICYRLDGPGSNSGRSTNVFFKTIRTGSRADPAS